MSAKTIEELVQELNIIVSEICKIAKFEKNIISQLKRSSTSIGANRQRQNLVKVGRILYIKWE